MERLKIEWYKTSDNGSEGYMELNLDTFFPCTVEKANKVFKLVRRWCSDETIADLEQFFFDNVKNTETKVNDVESKKEFSRIYQRMCDNQHILADRKYPNGVPVKKQEFEDIQKQVKADKKWVKQTFKIFRTNEKMLVKWHRMLRLFYANLSDRCTKKMKGSDERCFSRDM